MKCEADFISDFFWDNVITLLVRKLCSFLQWPPPCLNILHLIMSVQCRSCFFSIDKPLGFVLSLFIPTMARKLANRNVWWAFEYMHINFCLHPLILSFIIIMDTPDLDVTELCRNLLGVIQCTKRDRILLVVSSFFCFVFDHNRLLNMDRYRDDHSFTVGKSS